MQYGIKSAGYFHKQKKITVIQIIWHNYYLWTECRCIYCPYTEITFLIQYLITNLINTGFDDKCDALFMSRCHSLHCRKVSKFLLIRWLWV